MAASGGQRRVWAAGGKAEAVSGRGSGERRAVASAACWAAGETSRATKKSGRKIGPDFLRLASAK